MIEDNADAQSCQLCESCVRIFVSQRSEAVTSLATWCIPANLSAARQGVRVPRRQLLWDLKAPLMAANGPPALALPSPEERLRFGSLSARGRLWTEVAHTGVSVHEHLTALVSGKLRRMGGTPSGALPDLRDGCKVWVGGVVVSAQRPPTAKGTAFLALEDEGGLINVVLRPKVYEASRKALKSPFVVVEGRLQKRGQAISVLARKVIPVELETAVG